MSMTGTKPGRPAAGPLPAALRLGPVHLVVADADRSRRWYEEVLGLRAEASADGGLALGDGTATSIVLSEDPDARPAARHAGLYHYALLFPSREELGRAAVRALSARTPIQGLSDHGTHEAIYLPDPDGNGIELAADRPLEVWPSFEEEFARGGPAPLDLDSLLGTVRGEPRAATVGEGMRVGHVHLHVGDVRAARAFYVDVLGFELRADVGTAAFVSAGGYHHHLAFNVWKGRGVGPPPPHTAGLDHWTVELPEAGDVAAVRERAEGAGAPIAATEGGFRTSDPWQTAVEFVAARG